MQRSTKKKIIIADSSLLLFMIIGLVFAWFASNYNNTVNSNEVTVIADGALEISVDKTNWKSSLSLSSYEWFQNVKFTDVTGIGDGNFTRPELTQQQDYAEVLESGTWNDTPKASSVSAPDVKSDYAKFTLYMRCKEPLEVFLGKGSSVEPVDKVLTGPTGISNASSFGNFSKDIVTGAVRLSAVDTGSNRLFTWIPRPDIYVNTDKKITEDNIKLEQTTGPSFQHDYYNMSHVKQSLTKDTVNGNLLTGTFGDTDSVQLAMVNSNKDGDGFYHGQVDFYIWLEGCDNEARRAFVGGNFNVYLNITSQDTAAVETP